LIAWFSDGTTTDATWQNFAVTHGPTANSIGMGCSASNLDACVVVDVGLPEDWFAADYRLSSFNWTTCTEYTEAEAGWGRTPSWDGDSGCCTPTNPLTRRSLGCCSCNYDSVSGGSVAATVSMSECLDPSKYFDGNISSFIWSSDMVYDNRVLFRKTVPQPTPTLLSTPEPSIAPIIAPTVTPASWLFNLTNDTREETNIVHRPAQAACASALYDELVGVVTTAPTVSPPTDPVGTLSPTFRRPNIVFVLADDWGWNNWGDESTWMAGSTPEIDRLASEGLTLKHHYGKGECAPARASLLTGRTALGHGVRYSCDAECGDCCALPINESVLAEELSSQGFRTAMVGKWHLSASPFDGRLEYFPTRRGFDDWFGHTNNINYYTKIDYTDEFNLWSNEEIVTNATEIATHAGLLATNKAIELMQYNRANFPSQPLFLYFATYLIHTNKKANPADVVYPADDFYLDKCHSIVDSDMEGL